MPGVCRDPFVDHACTCGGEHGQARLSTQTNVYMDGRRGNVADFNMLSVMDGGSWRGCASSNVVAVYSLPPSVYTDFCVMYYLSM